LVIQQIIYFIIRSLQAPAAVIVILLLSIFIGHSAHAGYAAIVIDSHSGKVLHSRNADTYNYPASLTKMMTLLLVFEALNKGTLQLNKKLKVSIRASKQPASKLGLIAGQTITVEQAIRAISVKSANDVATVFAEELAGTETNFAKIMTKRAHQLGMKKTTFKNASGLPHKQQKSTARDMSILAQTLINKLPKYYNYFSIQSFVYKGKVFKNHNKLLQKYKGTDGIKTGYINASGFNLVASTKRDGTRLIGVVFGGKTANRRDRQMKRILNRSWERAKSFSLLRARPLPKHFIPKIEAKVLKNSSSEIEISLTSTNWGIQIGAFSKYKEARDIGSHTVHKLINLPVTASLKIQAVSKSNNTLFRTRLMGLNEMGARASCKQILVNGRECKIVTPNE